MRTQERATARKHLDRRLNALRDIEFARPSHGWVKAIREALGMTTRQLATRIGVSQPRVIEIERNEKQGSITLDSLERAAHALDCQLVFALVPKKPLETLIDERALRLAKLHLGHTAHSMALEDQSVDDDDQQTQLLALAKELAKSSGSKLWDEP